MRIPKLGDRRYVIPKRRFESLAYIDRRVSRAAKVDRSSLRLVLRYLYLSQGPKNLPRARKKAARPYLDLAETKVVNWLATRTNGSERKRYGSGVLVATRRSRFRCEDCGVADVRVLNLDHVDGRTGPSKFRCLCANCHHIKSFHRDW